MKFGVNEKALLYTAGCVWIFAGTNILHIGIVTWLNDTHCWLFRIGEAIIVFLFFFNSVFKRLLHKHSERISRKNERHCPFSFFDVKGWTIMIFMIASGVAIRVLHLLSNSFISVFYTGLSTTLIIAGFLFLRQGETVGNWELKIRGTTINNSQFSILSFQFPSFS